MLNSFSVFCLYADDVRQEVNNKMTYVGTYMGDLIATVPALPGQIPRLVAAIFVTIPKERDFQKVTIEMLWNGETQQTVEVKKEQIGNISNTETQDEASVINAVMVMEPMVIQGNGRIGVRVTLDDEVVLGNSLKATVNVIAPADLMP